MTHAASYPKRPAFHAHRVVRQLFKTCAAAEIGHTATLLVVFVAHTEDAKRYSSPPTFYNDQLLAILAVRKWDTLDRARRAAAEAGWLHYESPPNGARQAGVYWTMIPERFEAIDDAPIGETPYPINGDGKGGSYPQNGYGRGDGMGDGRGYGRGDGMGELPTLDPSPIPTPKKKPAGAGVPPELLELIDAWNSLPSGIVRSGNGARRDPVAKATLKGWRRVQREPELQEAFADIPRFLGAIREADFCHEQPWFSLAWLFGSNKAGEFNAVKLMNGGYQNGNGKPKQSTSDSPARIRRRGREYWESIPVEGG